MNLLDCRERPTRRLLLGLIGAGIQASGTPAMHEREAAAHGIHCLYQLPDLDLMHLAEDAVGDLVHAAERRAERERYSGFFGGVAIAVPSRPEPSTGPGRSRPSVRSRLLSVQTYSISSQLRGASGTTHPVVHGRV